MLSITVRKVMRSSIFSFLVPREEKIQKKVSEGCLKNQKIFFAANEWTKRKMTADRLKNLFCA